MKRKLIEIRCQRKFPAQRGNCRKFGLKVEFVATCARTRTCVHAILSPSFNDDSYDDGQYKDGDDDDDDKDAGDNYEDEDELHMCCHMFLHIALASQAHMAALGILKEGTQLLTSKKSLFSQELEKMVQSLGL